MREQDAQGVLREARKRFARVIREVVIGHMSADEGIESCEQIAAACGRPDESMARAIHALRHYRDDQDARQYDTAYAELQIRGLQAIIERFSLGLPLLREENYYWKR